MRVSEALKSTLCGRSENEATLKTSYLNKHEAHWACHHMHLHWAVWSYHRGIRRRVHKVRGQFQTRVDADFSRGLLSTKGGSGHMHSGQALQTISIDIHKTGKTQPTGESSPLSDNGGKQRRRHKYQSMNEPGTFERQGNAACSQPSSSLRTPTLAAPSPARAVTPL